MKMRYRLRYMRDEIEVYGALVFICLLYVC